MNLARLEADLKQAEGCRLEAYTDTKGIWTIGYGRNLEAMYPGKKNFSGLHIMQASADKWLLEDISTACSVAKNSNVYPMLDVDARQNAMIEMAFNLGGKKLAGFVDTLKAIRAQKWEDVAKHALDSDWHKQVGKRAERIAEMFRTGKFPE